MINSKPNNKLEEMDGNSSIIVLNQNHTSKKSRIENSSTYVLEHSHLVTENYIHS